MALRTLEHFLVLSHQPEATRDFYRDALGLVEGARPDLGFPGYWLYLGSVACIHIAEWRSYTEHSNRLGIPVSTPAAGTGGLDHLAFQAGDYEDFVANLARHSIAAHRHDTPAIGLRQLFLFDPNGIKLEINFQQPR